MVYDLKGEFSIIPELGIGGQHSCLNSAEILHRLGDKWTIMVLGALTAGPLRFNVLHRSIDDLSHRMLTLTLRKLQCDGLVSRLVSTSSPITVNYALTDMGERLIPHLRALVHWADTHKDRVAKARATFAHLSDAADRPKFQR